MPEKKTAKKSSSPKKESLEIKLPSIKKNPWALSTYILGLLLVAGIVCFFIFAYPSVVSPTTGQALSPSAAGQKVVSFLGTHVNGTIQLENVTEISGVYEISVLFQNQTVPVYATKDGNFLIQSLVPVQ